jgi:hypothetical protein
VVDAICTQACQLEETPGRTPGGSLQGVSQPISCYDGSPPKRPAPVSSGPAAGPDVRSGRHHHVQTHRDISKIGDMRSTCLNRGAPSKYSGLSRPTSATAVSCVCLPHLPLARVAAYKCATGCIGLPQFASGSAPVEISRTVPQPLTEVQTDDSFFLGKAASIVTLLVSREDPLWPGLRRPPQGP